MKEKLKYIGYGMLGGAALVSCAATFEQYQLSISVVLLTGGALMGALCGYGVYALEKTGKKK